MGNGIPPFRGPSGAPLAGPLAQENVQDTGKIDESKPKDGKVESQPADQPKAQPPVSNPSAQKLEWRMTGTARQAELQGQFQKKTEPGEIMNAARTILENPKLSNEAKLSELQKMIGKADKAEFAHLMAKLPTFSSPQKELINSAITESPKIMERVASELPQSEQLAVIRNSVMNPLRGSSEKEEKKRLERADKGIAAWMQGTDADTLNKALSGRTVNDVKTSARLFGVLTSDPARLIMGMGHHKSKIHGDSLEIAIQLMNMAINPEHSYTRDEIESAAQSLIVNSMQEDHDRSKNTRRSF